MTIYWILFTLPTLFLLCARYYSRRIENILWFGVTTLFIVVLGFRHEVGCDWYSYTTDLDNIPVHITSLFDYLSWIGQFREPGYALITWTAYQFNFGIYGVNLFCAIIFTTGLIFFCRSQPTPWLTLLLAIPYIVIVISMGYTRQATALGIIFWSLYLVQRNRAVASLILVACSGAFHKTSLLFLPLFAFFNTKILAKKALVIILVLLILILAFAFRDYVFQQWGTYVLRRSSGAPTGPIFRSIINAVPAVLFLVLYRRHDTIYPNLEVWLPISLACIVILILLPWSPAAADRLGLYLSPIQLYFWPRFVTMSNNLNVRSCLLIILISIYASFLYIWLNFSSHAACWVPYNNIFFSF